MKHLGILLMAYGGLETAEEEPLRAYLQHIRRGRPPSQEEVKDLQRRYQAIGGRSPLKEITYLQGQSLKSFLENHLKKAKEIEVHIAIGMKHCPPFIEEGIKELLQRDCNPIMALALAPHQSRMTTDTYSQAVQEMIQSLTSPISVVLVGDWHLHPLFLQAWARKIKEALDQLPPDTLVLFTAHSLPTRILSWNDPYPQQIEETASAIAQELGLSHWRKAYQSAGRTPEPWLGPDIKEALAEIKEEGFHSVLVAPIGFVADHLEILYDIDIDARQYAESLGLQLARPQSLNTDPLFISCLGDMVIQSLRKKDLN